MKHLKGSKAAFVHDRIFHIGGAEQLFFDLIQSSNPSEGRIFTLFSDRAEMVIDNQTYPVTIALPRRINHIFVWASRGNIWLLSKLFDYRNLIIVAPLLTWLLRRKINQRQPEQILISSFAAVKNIVKPHQIISQKPVTLYLHSPMQYIRENYNEYCRKLSTRQLRIFKPAAIYLRKRDKKIRQYEYVYTNSYYTQACAQRYYNLDSTVLYPQLNPVFTSIKPASKPHDYYLYVGRLVTFIRETDLIIKLFNELKLPLLIMGSGPDEYYLKHMAGDSIIFLGHISNPAQKAEIIRQAKGVVNLTKESCGIGTMEALACGTPVFAYGEGGSVELIQSEQGILVDDKSLDHLIEQFQHFAQQTYDRSAIQKLFWQHYQANNSL